MKWAFSEAAVLCLRRNPVAQRYVARLAQKHGKAKALTILAPKLARAVYFMLSRGHAFDATKFFPAAGAASPVRGAPRLDDAARAGSTRPVREGGRYLMTPEIDLSADEIRLAVDDDGVAMLSTLRD